MSVIEVRGLASQTSRFINATEENMKETLLDFLRANGVTIASSCDGEGVCKKCGIQNGWLTCELTLEEFLKRQPDGKIFVGYL